ncbi:MAG: hypothetical protein V2I65_04175 [Paracoccaceae bacterium]|jgi:hypothetical protein|nr:hypothetical protein [Paracoccaceae bacterium]
MSRHDPALARPADHARAVAARPVEGWLAAYYAYESPTLRPAGGNLADDRALAALEQMYAYYEA